MDNIIGSLIEFNNPHITPNQLLRGRIMDKISSTQEVAEPRSQLITRTITRDAYLVKSSDNNKAFKIWPEDIISFP